MYKELAVIYDRIQEINLPAWADFIIGLEKIYSQRTGPGDGREGRPLLLDLGCGTGGFCLEMAQRGYDPIGIDASEAMLNEAKQNSLALAGRPESLFLLQDIRSFELYGTVDIIVSLLDTVNHLVEKADLRRLFKLCANYLNPGGVMIFDLLQLDYMAQQLGDNIFFFDEDDYSLVWQNSFEPGRQISTADLTLFILAAPGRYHRFDESISERYYDRAVIEQSIRGTGLELVACHDDQELAEPDQAARHFYVLRLAGQPV